MKKDLENISALLVRARIYGIPKERLKEIVARDKFCVYCHIKMKRHLSSIGTPKDKATIEHFSNKAFIGESKNIGMCCGRCNSSRSNKKLFDWFKTPYCLERNINEKTVAKPIKDYIKRMGKKS